MSVAPSEDKHSALGAQLVHYQQLLAEQDVRAYNNVLELDRVRKECASWATKASVLEKVLKNQKVRILELEWKLQQLMNSNDERQQQHSEDDERSE